MNDSDSFEEVDPPPYRAPLRRPRVPWVALALDILLVLLFAWLGRRSHAEADSLLGLLETGTPFVAGTLAGWALLLWQPRVRPASVAGGVVIWLSTLVVGMVVRVLTQASTAPAFVAVAASVTALFLVGWRALGAYLVARAAATGPHAPTEDR